MVRPERRGPCDLSAPRCCCAGPSSATAWCPTSWPCPTSADAAGGRRRPWRGPRDDRDWPRHLEYGPPGHLPWRPWDPPRTEKGRT
jgi:hypothetical protein